MPSQAHAGRAFAAGMAELQAELRPGRRMDEIDDALPGRRLFFAPEPEAAGSYARIRRHAGHLAENDPGAAERAAAEMDEMKVVGTPSAAEYIAIGEMTMRFCNVSPRTR